MQKCAAVRQRQAHRAVLLIGPDVGERLQHAHRPLQQGAVAAEPPLRLHRPHPLQGEPQRLGGVEPGRRTGDRVLGVGAAQEIQRPAPVAAPPPVVGRGVQHLGQHGPFAYRPGLRGGEFRGVLGLAQQLTAALDLPQPQHAPGVLGPEFGVGARPLLVFGGAPQQLHGVDQVLHHAVRVEMAQERAGALHRRVRRAVGGVAAAPVAVERELLGQGHETLQYAGRDLGEGVRDARPASTPLPALVTLFALPVLAEAAAVRARPDVRDVRGGAPALPELCVRQRGKVRPALAEPLFYVLRAVLEHEQCLVPSQRSEQRLLDTGCELVPLPHARDVGPAARQQAAEQHLGKLGGPESGSIVRCTSCITGR